MCEDAACDDHREQVGPELMAAIQETGAKNAKARGLTTEEYQEANKLAAPKERYPSWLQRIWLSLKPSL